MRHRQKKLEGERAAVAGRTSRRKTYPIVRLVMSSPASNIKVRVLLGLKSDING